ncbi:MAG: hypothetical protein E6Z97_10565 [Staphylococcus epidermidis]|jgi:hypothetical protein|uniref:hypothetical protein n=1 Tax=Staphylococcus TaxID=1279 RepID=UPI000921355C|nr:hypothetical protein [Staphylococcus argenteus]MDU0851961.1 hypothetical protein [Veillonella sp.]MDU1612191.1 hypothetical protein [Staphylococcus epidermidis]MDU1789256.1 hypothetical protein [Streptococcus thermophilus]MDU3139862.1 hypothetical protein [Staphylococcus lugdunensis]MDU3768889.1 hypothetical protein [Cutibacterium granulosum]MDU3872470.1 hypothetical protein [Staphylococcus warneri]MDU3987267.1 hypothetical protein [Staphylococcus aureus]MDU4468571.1 hypothetical protein
MDNEMSGTRIIKHLARKYLENNIDREVSLREIRNFILKTTHKEYSHGMYSSAMRDLIEETDGKVLNPKRGIYQYASNTKKVQINNVLDECIRQLEELAYVNYLKINKDDIDNIKCIPKIIEDIKSIKL